MKRVLIIYTGGTIGMTRTENGYAPRAGYFRAALDAIPDLRAPEMPEWEFYELSPLLDSSNMTVREWNCIAELIAQKYDDYDGFVVLHGTDTMAYTASALSFMLDGLDKPVVLTGSLAYITTKLRNNKELINTAEWPWTFRQVWAICMWRRWSRLCFPLPRSPSTEIQRENPSRC